MFAGHQWINYRAARAFLSVITYVIHPHTIRHPCSFTSKIQPSIKLLFEGNVPLLKYFHQHFVPKATFLVRTIFGEHINNLHIFLTFNDGE
jgi:hypothetical protein